MQILVLNNHKFLNILCLLRSCLNKSKRTLVKVSVARAGTTSSGTMRARIGTPCTASVLPAHDQSLSSAARVYRTRVRVATRAPSTRIVTSSREAAARPESANAVNGSAASSSSVQAAAADRHTCGHRGSLGEAARCGNLRLSYVIELLRASCAPSPTNGCHVDYLRFLWTCHGPTTRMSYNTTEPQPTTAHTKSERVA